MQKPFHRNSPPPRPETSTPWPAFLAALFILLFFGGAVVFFGIFRIPRGNPPKAYTRKQLQKMEQRAPSLQRSIKRTRQSSSPKTLLTEAELPALSLSLDVNAAYAAIPHRQTTFDAASSTLPTPERNYLEKLFGLVDLGVAVRVSAVQTLQRNGEIKLHLQQYNQLIGVMRTHAAPPSLQSFHNLITAALLKQLNYLASLQNAGQPSQELRQMKSAPLVQQSSHALRTAYSILMRGFATRDPHNKTAFFDHLCALDFI